MEDKFMGVGLKRLIGISLFVMVFFVIAKIIVNKYPIKGLTEVVSAA